MPRTTENAANARPTMVTRCSGADVNEVNPLTASRDSDPNVHRDAPPSR